LALNEDPKRAGVRRAAATTSLLGSDVPYPNLSAVNFDISQWTVRVLEEGLPPPVESVALGQTIPVARWIKDRYGAVLFVRQWRNGQWDSDCASTAIDSNGKWHQPGSHGGGKWENPLVRPSSDGWNGKPVIWLNWGGGFSPIDDKYIRTIDGMTVPQVAAIELKHKTGELYQVVEVDSPYGAVVLGFSDDEAYLATPLDAFGKPFRGDDGEILGETLDAV